MNNRLTIKELAVELTKSTGKDHESIERFLNELITIVSENIFTDRLVQIKGIGTFKIIQVEKRESIDVNTKERIVIPEHYKLSFSPEKDLRETVNKPFSFFESIEINDDSDFASFETELEKDKSTDRDEDMDDDVDAIDADIDNLESESISEPVVPTLISNFKTEIVNEKEQEEEILNKENEKLIEPAEEIIEEEIITTVEEQKITVIEEQSEPEIIETEERIIAEPAIVKPVIDKIIEEIKEDKPEEEIISESVPAANAIIQETSEPEPIVREIVEEVEQVVEQRYEPEPAIYSVKRTNEEAKTEQETKEVSQEEVYDERKVNHLNENNMDEYSENRRKRDSYRDKEREHEQRSSGNNNNTLVTLLLVLVVILIIALGSVLFMSKDVLFQSGSNDVAKKETTTTTDRNQFVLPSDDDIESDSMEDEWGIDDDFDGAEGTEKSNETTTSPGATATTSSSNVIANVKTKRGDRLNLIALEYYGNKLFWVYIYEHNKSKITNPNSIAVGLNLEIPAKSVYNIDANDPASIRRASVLQTQILSNYPSSNPYNQYNNPYNQYNDPYQNQYQQSPNFY